MDALQKEMDSGEAKKKLLAKQIQHTTENEQKLEKEMKEYLNTRNAQNEAFKTALKADSDAVMLLAKTIEALSKYAENNLSLAQKMAGHKKSVRLFEVVLHNSLSKNRSKSETTRPCSFSGVDPCCQS